MKSSVCKRQAWGETNQSSDLEHLHQQVLPPGRLLVVQRRLHLVLLQQLPVVLQHPPHLAAPVLLLLIARPSSRFALRSVRLVGVLAEPPAHGADRHVDVFGRLWRHPSVELVVRAWRVESWGDLLVARALHEGKLVSLIDAFRGSLVEVLVDQSLELCLLLNIVAFDQIYMWNYF